LYALQANAAMVIVNVLLIRQNVEPFALTLLNYLMILTIVVFAAMSVSQIRHAAREHV
jgi:hypothetical protein